MTPHLNRRALSKGDQFGFTLIELMVTIAVSAVLIMVAVPSFNDAILNSKLTGNANNLLSSIQVARSEAIKRNTVVLMCRSADGKTCATTGGWEQGWVVRVSGPVSATDPDPNLILVQPRLPAIMTVTGPTTDVSFQPIGAGSTVAAFKICPVTVTSDRRGRDITLSATGRGAVSPVKTAVCT